MSTASGITAISLSKGFAEGHTMTMELQEIDKKLRQLRRETSGLEGAVLRAADPQAYAAKMAELAALTHEYFRYFFGGTAGSNPFP